MNGKCQRYNPKLQIVKLQIKPTIRLEQKSREERRQRERRLEQNQPKLIFSTLCKSSPLFSPSIFFSHPNIGKKPQIAKLKITKLAQTCINFFELVQHFREKRAQNGLNYNKESNLLKQTGRLTLCSIAREEIEKINPHIL